MQNIKNIKLSELSATERDDIVSLALKIMKSKHRKGSTLGSPEETAKFLQLHLGDSKNEVFGMVFLDNRHRVIDTVDMFTGTIDGASVYPREILAKALELNAAACILYHNHPSGVVAPSGADRRITTKIKEVLGMVDIRVLDHIVVSHSDSYSFAEHGIM